jgi:RNase P subunit RPR2
MSADSPVDAPALPPRTVHMNPPMEFCPECNSLLRPVVRLRRDKPTLAHLCHWCGLERKVSRS